MHNSSNSLLATMDYKNSQIAFEEINGKMMINATQMAKPFGNSKKPRFWLRTQQAKDLLKVVSKMHKCNLNDLQIVKYGGNNPGTWFHEDLALLFAQWLSPEFYLACNTKLKELLQQKVLEVPSRHGVKGTLIDGKVVYAYMDAMRIFGNVHTSSSRRRKRHPEHFTKRFGRNFVTAMYLDAMHSYYAWKDASNQLKLSF